MIKVSIIVPVYNVEKYLTRCLESLVNQTEKDIEIIIVNDGSPDNSQEIIDQYTKKYSFIKSYIKENGGLSDARNYGLERAKGQYIMFIDSDDYIEKQMVEKMLQCAQKNKSDIVVCNIMDEYEKTGTAKEYFNYIPKETTNIFENKQILFNRFAAWNKLYNKNLFKSKDMRFEKGKIYEDLRLILKLYIKSEKISYVKDSLYHYIIRPGSIMTSSAMEKNLDIILAFEDIIDYYKTNNIYDSFKDEIEFLAIEHIYISANVRVINAKANSKDKKKIINKFIQYMNNNFKNYKNNKYIQNLSFNKKIIFHLLNMKLYGIIKLIFKIKNS